MGNRGLNQINSLSTLFNHFITGGVDYKCIIPSAANHAVVASAAIRRIVSSEANQRVIPCATCENIATAVACDDIAQGIPASADIRPAGQDCVFNLDKVFQIQPARIRLDCLCSTQIAADRDILGI